jgi:hypothetical protein
MRRHPLLGLVFLSGTACGGGEAPAGPSGTTVTTVATVTTVTTGTAGTTTTGGSGGAAIDGGAPDHAVADATSEGSCSQFAGDPATPVKIRIENTTDDSAWIPNTCLSGSADSDGLDAVFIDGDWALDRWFRYSCDDLLAGQCRPPDCFGGPMYELKAHAIYEGTWSGHLLVKDSVVVPRACGGANCEPQVCRRRVAAAPGEHVLKVEYKLGDAAATSVEVKFTMPTTVVTATIAR